MCKRDGEDLDDNKERDRDKDTERERKERGGSMDLYMKERESGTQRESGT